MARPSKTGSKKKAAKTRKATHEGRKPFKAERRVSQVSTRTKHADELEEAREQQAATADILKVIASSRSDAAPVFEAIASSANRLIGGFSTAVYRVIDDIVHLVAFTPTDPVADDALKKIFPLHRSQIPPLTLVQSGQTAQIADAETADAESRRIAHARGWRSATFTPLISQDTFIGFITCTRREVGVLPNHHVQLLRTFADQAVIAIENARLFNETREALERQTATADVLKVIASSPSDVQPVFEAIAESARRLLGSHTAVVTRVIDDTVHLAASTAATEAPAHAAQGLLPYPLSSDRIHARVARTRQIVFNTDAPNSNLPQEIKDFARAVGWRSMLVVPMLRNEIAIGTIGITRREPGEFDEKTVGLLKTFADQAVIAIENSRLFNETKEALERQTATADVLKVISRSSVNLGTVLDTLVQAVARLCGADQVFMFHLRNDLWHLIAHCGLSAEASEFFETNPFTPGRGSTSGRAALERRAILVPDVLQDSEYTLGEGQKVAGYRTTLGIPLLREDTLIGVYSIARTRVEPFTDKEIELATSFADQAVIAIENARLFEELRERQAELRVTFDNMGDGVVMFGADKKLVAWNRNLQELLDLPDAFLISRPSFAELFRYLATRGEFGSADLEAELSQSIEDATREMRYERERPDGRVVEVRRNPVPDGGFVLIYADITERKRAEEAIRLARDAAEKALRDLQAAQDRLIQTEKLASLGQLTAGIAHEIKNPLNFVNNFSALSVELTEELNDILNQAALAEQPRKEVNELTGMLKDNLSKVVQHGKRADSIVKNMLLHSRESTGERRSADINALVGESLNLAYHGARAEKAGFNIELKHDLDPEAGSAELYPQEIIRALLNVISNGFYAATKREAEAGAKSFEPVLSAATRDLGKTVEIRIRDNGLGILPEVREKIFNPFFTTKPTGEGTGLGLSMTHDIIVKQHGGTIDVETKLGEFTEFIITLPRDSLASARRQPP